MARGQNFREKHGGGYSWALIVRLVRALVTLLALLRGVLSPEQFSSAMQAMAAMLDDDSVVVTPAWHRVLVLEAFLALVLAPGFVADWFACAPAVFHKVMDALCRIVVAAPELERTADAPSRGLELLGDAEPPAAFNAALAVIVALECVVGVVDALAEVQSATGATLRVGALRRHASTSSGRTRAHSSNNNSGGGAESDAVRRSKAATLDTMARPCAVCLSHVLAVSEDEQVIEYVLRAYLSLTNSVGALRLQDARETLVKAICKHALPAQQSRLSQKHLLVLKALFNVAHGLGGVLEGSWTAILETMEKLDGALWVHFHHATSSEDETAELHLDTEAGVVESMLANLFDSSRFLDDEALRFVVVGLSQLVFAGLATSSTATPTRLRPVSPQPSNAASNNNKQLSSTRRLFATLRQSFSPNDPSGGGGGEQGDGAKELDAFERFPPFALEKIIEVYELNSSRAHATWEIVGSTLVTVASAFDSRLRLFACKAMERLVTSTLTLESGPKREVVKKFSELIRSPHSDTKEAALQSLHRIVSAAGPHLEGLWTLVVAELLIVATHANRSLHAPAFKVVQLIMDDYRPSLDAGCLPSLALCLRAFGDQPEDINMALTAVHHLWLLCEKGDDTISQGGADSTEKANALWLHVFFQLSSMSLDPRMEVRNSALRSLCTNIVATGDRLTLSSWKVCALEIMLPLVHDISQRAGNADGDQPILGEKLASHSDERMTVHHSKDTEEKQWRETRIIALQGASKIVIGIVQRVPAHQTLDWFNLVWSRILVSVDRAITAPSSPKDVVAAGIAVWEELALLACGVASRTRYAVPGMKVVNGSLSREAAAPSAQARPHLWPPLLELFVRAAHVLGDVDTGGLLFNGAAELFVAKDCAMVRQAPAVAAVVKCASEAVDKFAAQGGRFVSPLERAVLHLYRQAPPLASECWPGVLQAVWAMQRKGDDDLCAKALAVFVDLFSQADAVARAQLLVSLLKGEQRLPDEVLARGLEALPSSGMPVFTQEDVWMQVLVAPGDVTWALKLLAAGKVPAAVRARVVERVAGQGAASLVPLVRACGDSVDADLVHMLLPHVVALLRLSLAGDDVALDVVDAIAVADVPALESCVEASALARRVAARRGPALVAQELDAVLRVARAHADEAVRLRACEAVRALVDAGFR